MPATEQEVATSDAALASADERQAIAAECATDTLAIGADRLVVGSRCYRPVRRTLLGAVSSRLMHQATCPVLVLPRRAGYDPLRLGARGLVETQRLAA